MSRRLSRPRRTRPSLGGEPATAAASPVRLRAKGAPDLLALIPYKLGFHPLESMVAVFVDGRRIRLTARLDLPPLPEATGLARGLRQLARRNGADQVVLFAYSAHAEPTRALMAEVLRMLPRRLVREALYVDGSRWWSLTCGPDCCPAEGTPYDVDSHRLAAEAVFAGMTARGSRAELSAAFAGPAEDELSRLDEVAARLRGPVGDLEIDRAVRRLTEVVRAGPVGLDDDGCAELALLVADLRLRDVAWTMIDPQNASDHVDLWQRVVSRVSPPLSAGPLALAGMAGWIGGDGAILNCAVEELSRRHPDYSMGDLLATISAQAVPPRMWETIGREVHEEVWRSLEQVAG